MDKLESGRETRRNLVARAEGLDQFGFASIQIFALPNCFQRRVVSENEWSEIFLRDQFRLPFKEAIADLVLLIDGEPDWIDHGVAQVVDQLERGIGIGESRIV